MSAIADMQGTMSDDFLDPRRAERLTRAARAAQTLSETLWEALQEQLSDPLSEPSSQRVAELSSQLGEVAATVASLARVDARGRESEESAQIRGQETFAGESPIAPVEPESRFARATYGEPLMEEPALPWEPPKTQESLSPAVLVDELALEKPPQIEIRDVRGEEGPAAWIGSIGRRLERHEQDGSPFAVLLVELVDIKRLHHAEPSGEVSQ